MRVALLEPFPAVCLCAYISKPVVTAPPRHYLSHASAPIFIGEVIHEASSSSPLLPYPPWVHKQRALSRESRGEGEERLFHSHSPIKIVRTSILPRAIRPLPFFFLVPLIDKEFVRVGRYGKTARSAFESSYVAVVSLKRTDRWKDRQSRLVEMGREASGTNFYRLEIVNRRG